MKRVRNGKAYLQAGLFMDEPRTDFPRMSLTLMHLLLKLRAPTFHSSFASTIDNRDKWKDDHWWMIS